MGCRWLVVLALMAACTTKAPRPINDTGQNCQKDADCHTGQCVTIVADACQGDVCFEGRRACATTCATDADCVPGWGCSLWPLQKTGVCACSPSTEICDNLDNDCNGAVDDKTAPCGHGGTCENGACQCSVAWVSCIGACVDTYDDLNNCGACGNVCPQGSSECARNQCECPTGQAVCQNACVDVTSDAQNCGGCGVRCPATQICSSGACGCSADLTMCGTACVDPMTDAHHCGGCDLACPAVVGATAQCTGGVCGSLEVLAPMPAAGGIVQDTDALFWVDEEGTLLRFSKSSRDLSSILGIGGQGSCHLGLAGDNVYWANRPHPQSIFAVSLSSGVPTRLLGSIEDVFFGPLTHADAIYWVSGASAVMQMPVAGGSSVTLGICDLSLGVTADAGHVYWVTPSNGSDSTFTTLAPDGSTRTVGSSLPRPTLFAAVDENLAVTFGNELQLLSGTDASRLDRVFTNGTIRTLTHDASNFYWIESDARGQLSLVRRPLAGGALVTLARDFSARVECPGESLLVDDTSLYWSTGTQVVKLTPK